MHLFNGGRKGNTSMASTSFQFIPFGLRSCWMHIDVKVQCKSTKLWLATIFMIISVVKCFQCLDSMSIMMGHDVIQHHHILNPWPFTSAILARFALLQWHLFAPLFIVTAFHIIIAADALKIPFNKRILCFNAIKCVCFKSMAKLIIMFNDWIVRLHLRYH